MRVAICALLIALSAGTAHAEEDEDSTIEPQGIPATHGQYQGFLDWVARQRFTADSVPADITDAYWHCVYPAGYDLMDGAERDVIDTAARNNGMTPVEKKIFFDKMYERLGGAGRYWSTVLKSCTPQFQDYWNYITKGKP